MRIADGIEMLEVSGTVMGSPRLINLTLLSDGRSLILVDTGFPAWLDPICSAIEASGHAFDTLSTLIITHQDIDHIGGLSAIQAALPKPARVLAHRDEIPYINGSKTPHKLARLQPTGDSMLDEQRVLFERMKRGFDAAYYPVDEALTGGQELPFAGGLQVIPTPGHTIGHISLYHKPSKTLIAGDALFAEGGLLMPSRPSLNYDNEQALASLKQLTSLDIQAIICYHGGLFTDHPNERLAQLTAA